uniref:Uncharacterized protein n=1 Tax=Panagrolaimus sp. ES5 TaxID=591445 RepID=A0AC34FPD0_9BILA
MHKVYTKRKFILPNNLFMSIRIFGFLDIEKTQIISYYSEICREFKSGNENDEMFGQTLSIQEAKNSENDSDEEENTDSEKSDEQEEDEDSSPPFFKIINANRLFVDSDVTIQQNFKTLMADKFFIQIQKVNFSEDQTMEAS